MSTSLAEFEAFSLGRTQCIVVKRQAELQSQEDRDNLEAALKAEHISAKAIKRWFFSRGIRIDDKPIKLHRDGECCCV